MLATLKILILLIFAHLDAMAAPKLVLKCFASWNDHHFPSCISQLQNFLLFNSSPVRAILDLLASNTGEKRFSRFFQDFQRNKMQEIIFILLKKNHTKKILNVSQIAMLEHIWKYCNAGNNHQEKMKC